MASDPNSLEENGVMLLFGNINAEASEGVTRFVMENNISQKHKHLTLIVNSYGGSLPDAFAIADIMAGSTIPVHTVGLGVIASSGLVIFMSGEKGHRILTPNTSILSHQWSWGTHGKQHELLATQKEFDLTKQRMMDHYIRHSGLSEKEVREKLLPPEDVWLSAKEAKKLNLCDKIKLY